MHSCSIFLDTSVTPTPAFELFTDTASTVGFGGFFDGQWFQDRWPSHMQLSKVGEICIEWQELFPIVVACAIWYPYFMGEMPTVLVW